MARSKNKLSEVTKKAIKDAVIMEVDHEVKREYERTKGIKEAKENLKVIWKDNIDDDDYDAARDYLDLMIGDKGLVKKVIKRLKRAKIITKKSKDILRASRLPKLPADNIHVQHNINKYRMNIRLSPILLVRGLDMTLIIADGYHRVCASYELSEDLNVPCKLVSIR